MGLLLLFNRSLSAMEISLLLNPQTPISSNPEQKKLVMDALDDIYNFQFAEASGTIELIRKKLPKHPIYHMLEAMNLDWQWEPVLEDKYKEKWLLYHLNRTLKICDSLQHKSTGDLEVMFIQFTAHGFLARVNAILGNYVDAVNHSMSAYNSVKKGFALKEKFYDFYFSTGMYNYYRERYPELHPVVKPFAMMLASGDPELGIKQLKFSYAHSLFSKIESANYLINIFYKYEGKPDEAFHIAEEVNRKYRGNLFFTVKYAEGIFKTGKNKADLNALIEKLLASGSRYYLMCGHYFKSMRLQLDGKAEEAFGQALKSAQLCHMLPKLKDNFPAYIYMNLSKLYQKRGNLKEAVKYMKIAKDKAEYPATHQEADAWLDKYD